jgi:hypothetical protein
MSSCRTAHSLVVDTGVQLSFPTISVSFLVEHVDHIIPAARRLAVVVEQPRTDYSALDPRISRKLVP